ncbi:ClpP/crotonase-like domain-containing protein [Phyllosticta capitalensis]|uniref:ClpP/crotonase-like domain-containing protein n=1 Tax=Phyllosticta capitalensis TaxID=121624 RepID=A0ABR1Z2P2_9PEZI
MIPNPPPVVIPDSYERVPLKAVKAAPHSPGVIVVTLNRPNKQNAFTLDMMEDLETLYAMFDVDERVKVVVLTGAGRTFCAGADLEIGFSAANEVKRVMDERDSGGRVALAIYRCRKPTIAAMQGSAVGLGMTITLPAAIRIGFEGGKYGFVFARRGITMESCSSFFLPRLIGYSSAMYLLSTGDTYPPNSPHFGHLFQETLPEASAVLPRALELAKNIVQNVSPLASYMNKCLMWHNPGSAESAHLLDSAVLFHMFQARDQQEGVSAFMEKRRPQFQATVEDDAPPNFPWWYEIDTGRRPLAAVPPPKGKL